MTADQCVPEAPPVIDYRLDLRGEPCPYPLMHALDVLGTVPPGRVVEVLADCPQAYRAVPEEAVKHGHEMLGPARKQGPEMIFLFRAAADSANARRATPSAMSR